MNLSEEMWIWKLSGDDKFIPQAVVGAGEDVRVKPSAPHKVPTVAETSPSIREARYSHSLFLKFYNSV